MKITAKRIRRLIIDFACITFGAVLAAFALEEFLIPNSILDGGVNGVSIILQSLTGIPISVFIICINIPFLILGRKTMGKEFLLKTAYGMIIFAVFLEVFAPYAEATDDMLLATAYGGLLLGVAVGLVIRFGGCLDGTEVAAIIISKKTNFSVGQAILAFNFVIYTTAGFLFGVERALYSLLTYFICYKLIDIVVDGFDQTKSVLIVTNQAEEIADEIYKTLGRTVTLMDGRGFIKGENTVMYVVVTRLELSELKEIVDKPDRQAFMTISEVTEVYGRHIKKIPKKANSKEVVKEETIEIKKEEGQENEKEAVLSEENK